ncbi:MAG: hypothetical protein RLZZ292_2082, partial [Bacteroidota bacterium]
TACSKCGRTDMSLTTYMHATTLKKHYMCVLCQAESREGGKRDIASYDEELKQYAELSEMYEKLILSMPKEVQAMQGLDNTLQTPLTIFRDIKHMIAHLESKRMEAVIAQGGEVYLNAELEKAIAAEDFEKAASVHSQLDALKKK